MKADAPLKNRASWRKFLVVGFLYFAEGAPFGFVNNALAVYFRSYRMSLENIGFMVGLAGLAWSVKFLWSPLIDRFGRRHHWIIPSQIILALSMLAMLFVHPGNPGILLYSLVFVMALVSATQDIAIDAYTIDILDERELGMANGIRTGGYRIALILSGGGLVALSGLLGWNAAFVGLAVIFGSMGCLIFFWKDCHADPRPKKNIIPARFTDSWSRPIRDLARRPNLLAVILFVLLFKVGDTTMGPMIAPFWVDRGFSRVEIGLISGTLGPVASITGAIMGGWLTTRWGIARALWSLGALQALSNLGYAYAALAGGKLTVYGASFVESFSGGLGTAPFMAFLMALCSKKFSATQYAFLTTIFGFSRSISGMLGGYGAANLGYAGFFFFTFLCAIPAFIFLPWVLPAIKRALEPAES